MQMNSGWVVYDRLGEVHVYIRRGHLVLQCNLSNDAKPLPPSNLFDLLSMSFILLLKLSLPLMPVEKIANIVSLYDSVRDYMHETDSLRSGVLAASPLRRLIASIRSAAVTIACISPVRMLSSMYASNVIF